ncbi:OmpA family protein [Flavobacteriales bacterium]|nr:OmpA family protein [Flavobacteriales bacterium]
MKKIENQIARRAFYAAWDELRVVNDFAVFSALKAEILWSKGEFFNAETQALHAINICPDNFPKVYYFLGEIAFNRKDYVNADLYLRKSIDLGISDPYYSDAVNLYSKANVLAEIINNPVPFTPKSVSGISTQFDEYLPIISPDQELAFFTRRSDRINLQSITNTTVEEFTFSTKIRGEFEVGQPLAYPFNIDSNEGGASITIDNSVLYYTKCIRNKKGYNNCDIYYVNRENGAWSEVQTFSDKISKSDSWESQPSVSADGKTIIFSSDRSGGYGKIDLYEINYENREWTSPKNLGSTINSNEHEKSPYLHPDGRTLFFASTNFPSIGGFDIFYSRKDSVGNWQSPINIGYPINTVDDEISLFVSTDGNKAYFASNQLNGIGGWDIYSFPLHDRAKPKRVLFLKGELVDEDGQSLSNFELEIKNISTKEVTNVEIKEGSYVSCLTLAKNDDVLIMIKKEGFAFNSTYISANDSSFTFPQDLNIELESLEDGKSFRLSNIYFETNSYQINPIIQEVLIEFADYLKINNKLVIEINGFTDNIGNESDNQLLSENRAKAVRDLVLSEGVQENRVLFNGYGERFPIADNISDKGRATNRRTEFRIISQ